MKDIKAKIIAAILLLAAAAGITVVIKDDLPVDTPDKIHSIVFEAVSYPVLYVSDSITNDVYEGVKKCYDAINKAGGGELHFEKSIYIDRYVIAANSNKKNKDGSWMRDKDGQRVPTNFDLKGNEYEISNPELILNNLKYLKIKGEPGAIISVKGDFHRPVTNVTPNKSYVKSDHYAMDPVVISNSKNIIIENIEIRGSVQETVRDSLFTAGTTNDRDSLVRQAAEAGGRLLSFFNCQNVIVQNVYLHHAQTDGLALRATRTPGEDNRGFTFKNVVMRYNARQGSTIANLFDSKFIDCTFDSTGYNTGDYGFHDPGAGLDIEPDLKRPLVDNILFENCNFEGNRKSLLVSHSYDTKNITFKGCTFTAPELEANKYLIVTSAVNVTFDSCIITAKNQLIYPSFDANTSTTFKNCYISGVETFRAVTNNPTQSLVIDNCTLEYTGTGKVQSYFPYLRAPNSLIFTNNKIIFPLKATKKDSYNGSSLIIAKESKGNVYLEK